jgi:hypothetical protein
MTIEEDDVCAVIYQALAAREKGSGHYGVPDELEEVFLTGEGEIYFREKKTIMDAVPFVIFLGFVTDNLFHHYKKWYENGRVRVTPPQLDAMLTAIKSGGNEEEKIERVLKLYKRLGDDAPSASAHYREKIKALVEKTKRQVQSGSPQRTSAVDTIHTGQLLRKNVHLDRVPELDIHGRLMQGIRHICLRALAPKIETDPADDELLKFLD